MATSLSLENDSSLAQGYLKVNGSTAATLTTSGITGNLVGNVTGNLTGSLTQGGSLTLATAQAASGTAVDFTGIPSWVKRITIILDSLSTGGASNILFQIGASSFETTGYNSYGNTGAGATTSTAGFILITGGSTTNLTGHIFLSKINGSTWVCSGVGASMAISNQFTLGGVKTITGTLARLRLTTVSGTDTFDAGTINIAYEG
jgi:hypothetical protein